MARLYTQQEMQSRRPRHVPTGLVVATAFSLLAACTTGSPPEETGGPEATGAEMTAPEPTAPALVFINLLPWGEVDFARGQFPSLGDCNALVRSFPSYSFYTTPERCEPIADPVYCTVWRDGDGDHNSIGCHKGPGGCEIELRRHDLLAESGSRTIVQRCEPFSLEDAWERYQASAPASGEVNPR